METSNFSENQIIKTLKENGQGRSVSEISRELGIDKSTFYYWRKKYGDMKKTSIGAFKRA
ncbi:transposase [Myroides indicus]|uniref:Transposase n=1 Tax=Myroides indicus TaxID=1323422 RepID=A0A4R7F4W6_9FLAO|nr:transposase [Myroides indicus]TDS65097.1 transposase [Myroides indicus]